MPEKTPAQKWFDSAEKDLVDAEELRDSPRGSTNNVAFHSQQAAEKYLKGFLVLHDIRPPRTHDLEELLDLAEEMDDELRRLREIVLRLADYAVAPRYPETGEQVSKADAENAVGAAKRVRDAVEDSRHS